MLEEIRRAVGGGGGYRERGFGVALRVTHYKDSSKIAFTLAEMLITIVIIGIVAALTLPNLIANYQKQVTVGKLKKAYSLLSQVAQKSIADNGEISFPQGERIDAEIAKNFFNMYWLPYFDGVDILKNKQFFYKYQNGEQMPITIYSADDFGRIFFTTKDGISYFVLIKGTKYIYDNDGNVVSSYNTYTTNQEVYVDINGLSSPNIIGKDVFRFRVDFDKGVVLPYGNKYPSATLTSDCNNTGFYCAAKIIRDGWEIKPDYPW